MEVLSIADVGAVNLDSNRTTTSVKQLQILQWIDDIDEIDRIHQKTSVRNADSIASSQRDCRASIRSAKGISALEHDTANAVWDDSILEVDDDNEDIEVDFDFDDDCFVDAARAALDEGQMLFDAKDWNSANACLTDALSQTKELAQRKQATCDTFELRRMLAVCCFHQTSSTAEAERALLSVLKSAPKNTILNDKQRLKICEVSHMLAQISITLGNLGNSFGHCEYALRGRRKVLGKTHEQSHESLALMARILALKENQLRADFFMKTIPENDRERFVQAFADLKLPADMPAREEAEKH